MRFNVLFNDKESEMPVDFNDDNQTFNMGFKETQVMNAGITNEVDPTVPEWAKQPRKPTYTIKEIGGSVGEDVSGTVQIPYTIDQQSLEYTWLEPLTAYEGAEILNCYGGDVDGMGIENVDRNIATGFMSQASGFRTQARGNYSQARGWWTIADGQCSIAEGLLSRTEGHFCHAEGTRTVASINNAHSEGDMTKATGRQSHSEGQSTTSSGFCSHSEGSGTVSSGYYSHAEGLGTIAKGKNQTAMGKYNIADTTSLLIVGKGTKDTDRSNAFTVSSAGVGWFSNAVTSAGADYAEYFEWLDGNNAAEDRVGCAVTLEGDKIRLANRGDDILGFITGTAMVVGDNAEYEWKYKYVKDEYGRIIYDEPVEEFAEYTDPETWETVMVSTGFHAYPKVSPEYNPDDEYISREMRKEWDPVGLFGKLHVNDDGTCVVGGYAEVDHNGIVTASASKTNMRVMKRITDSVVLLMVK